MKDYKWLPLIALFLVVVSGFLYMKTKAKPQTTMAIDGVLEKKNDSLLDNNQHINIKLKDSKKVKDSLLYQLEVGRKVIVKTTRRHYEKINRMRHNDTMELYQFFSGFETQDSNH